MSNNTEIQTDELPSPKKRKRSVIGLLFKGFFLLVLALVVAIVFLIVRPTAFSLNQFADTINEQVSRALGREISIEGDIKLITGMIPSIRIEKLTVENPPEWESDLPFASFDQVETAVGLPELIRKKINIDDIHIEGLTLSLETNTEGRGNWEGFAEISSDSGEEKGNEEDEPSPTSGGPTLQFEELGGLTIHDLSVFTKEGDLPRKTVFQLDRLEGSAPLGKPVELDLEGTLLSLPYRGHLKGGTLTELRARIEAWPVEVTGTLGDSSIEVAGNFSARNFTVPGNIRFKVDIPDLEQLIPLTGELPDFGTLSLAGEATRESKDHISLPTLSGKLGESPVSGAFEIGLGEDLPRVEGSLKVDFIDVAKLQGNEDSSTASSKDPEPDVSPTKDPENETNAPQDNKLHLPFVGSLELELGELKGELEGTEIRDLGLVVNIEERAATAELSLVFTDAPLSGSLEITRISSDQLTFHLGLYGKDAELSELIAYYTETDDFEGHFESLHYEFAGNGETFADAWKRRTVELEIKNAQMIYRDGTKERQFTLTSGTMARQSPDPGVFKLVGILSEAPFEFSLKYDTSEDNGAISTWIHSITGKIADVEVEITNDSPNADKGAALSFSLKGGNLEQLDKIYELNLPPLGPYSASGKFVKTDQRLDLSEIELQVGSSTLQGACSLDRTSTPPRLTADLHSELLQLNDFSVEGWSPIEGGEKATNRNLLSHESLSVINAEIALSVGRALSGKDLLGKADVKAILKDGRFEIEPITLGIPGGKFTGKFLFDPKPDGSLDWKAKLEADSFELGILARRAKPDTDFSAIANFNVEVSAIGIPYGKPHLEAATGRLDFDICPRNFTAGGIDLWATNLVFALLPKLDKKNESKINCILGRLRLDDGVIFTESLGMDTTKIRVAAEGQIDLAGNKIELKLTPTPKRPQLFSLELPIGIEGTLTDPSIEVGKMPLIRTVGKMAKNTLLFPAKLVAGDRLPEDGSDICPCLQKP